MSNSSIRRTLLVLGSLLLGWPLPPAAAQSDTATAVRMVEGLRQRRLWELAEQCCALELEHLIAAQQDPLDLVLQWIQTRVDEARQAPAANRAAAWDRVHQLARDSLSRFAAARRAVLIELQAALAIMAQAEAARDEWALERTRPEPQTEGREAFRRGSQELAAVANRIAEIRLRTAGKPEPGGFSPQQLLAMENHVALEQARCFQGLATLHPDSESAERIDALARVDRQLQELSGRISANDTLAWEVRLLRSACLRDLGQIAEAQRLWTDQAVDAVPETLRPAWWREQIRLALAAKNLDPILAQAAQFEPLLPQDPDLGLAILELALVQSQASRSEADREKWQQRIAQQLGQIEQVHGPYWLRRASQLVAQSIPAQSSTAPSNLVAQLAAEALHRGAADEALRLWEIAGERAATARDLGRAFECQLQAAAIQQSREQWSDAADRFRQLAAAYPDHPQAAEANLWAAWNLARELKQQPGRLPEYVQLLRTQLAKWPNAPPTHEAATWLAKVYAAQGEFGSALATLATIPSTAKGFAAAVDQAETIGRQWLQATSRHPSQDLAEAAATLTKTLETWAAADPGPATVPEQRLQLFAQQVALAYLEPNLSALAGECTALAAAMREVEPATLAETAGGTAFLAQLAAGAAFDPTAAQVPAIPPDELWLAAWKRYSNGSHRGELSNWLLTASARREPNFESPAARDTWNACKAVAHWHRGDSKTALAAFGQLIAANPRDLATRQFIGRVLLHTSDPAAIEFGLTTWRAIAAGSPPQSEAWFEAKLAIAKMLAAGGSRSEAVKMLRYLQAVPPGWTQSILAPQFEQLLRELSQ